MNKIIIALIIVCIVLLLKLMYSLDRLEIINNQLHDVMVYTRIRELDDESTPF